MKSNYIFILFCFIIANNSLAATKDEIYKNAIIPQIGISPEVAMLGKFDYVAVGKYTGVPNISIPLYTISESGQEIPIVLQYNTSGIKVNEEATWVGLGWNLNVGGTITHIPVGKDDRWDRFYDMFGVGTLINGQTLSTNMYTIRSEKGKLFNPCNTNLNTSQDNYDVFSYTSQEKLGQPDIYTFSTIGSSGKFIYDPIAKKYQQINNKNTQVSINQKFTSFSSDCSKEWNILDMNGIQYNFLPSDAELNIRNNWRDPDPLRNTGSTTWKLSNVVYPSGSKVTFSYSNGRVYSYSINETLSIKRINRNTEMDTTIRTYRSVCETKYLNKIETKRESIIFELSSSQNEREDLKGEDNNGSYSAKRLNYIHVLDKTTNQKILSYRFIYDYYNGGSNNGLPTYERKRLKLKSIMKISYNKGVKSDSLFYYGFEYNEKSPLPAKHSCMVDYWGYYNGQGLNSGYLPKLSDDIFANMLFPADSVSSYSPLAFSAEEVRSYTMSPTVIDALLTKTDANRGADSLYTSLGVLTKIIYPTKGYCKLQYESNDFTNQSILSAKEIGTGVTGYKKSGLFDIKSCKSPLPKTSTIFTPDPNGKLNMRDIKLNISRIRGNTINFTTIKNAYAKIICINPDNSRTEIKKWGIPDSAANTFNNTGKYNLYLPDFTTTNANKQCRYMVEISLGTGMQCQTDTMPPSAIIQFSFSYRDSTQLRKRNYIGGGLRIVNEALYDQNDSFISNKVYDYTNDDGFSSGKLMSPPKFFSYREVVNKFYVSTEACSAYCEYPSTIYTDKGYLFSMSGESYIPLSYDAEGALVGYSKVTITDINKYSHPNGKTIYYYNNTPSLCFPAFDYIPNIPNLDNGMENRIEYYNKDNVMINKTLFNYASVQDTVYKGVDIVDNYVGPDMCIKYCCGPAPGQDPDIKAAYDGVEVNPFAYAGRWLVIYYPLSTKINKPTKKTDCFFYNNKTLTNEYNYTYNSLGQLTNEMQILDSGIKQEKKYRYLTDVTSGEPIYITMRNKSLYNALIDEKTVKNESLLVDGLKYTYSNCPSGNVKPSLVQKTISTNIYDLTSNIIYDSIDNTISYKHYNQPNTVILWSYNYQYPIVKIEGLTYAEVTATVGSDIIDNLAKNTAPTRDVIEAIRTKIEASGKVVLVSTYTYAPLIGMTSKTDTRGVTTYYQYDDFNRLNETYIIENGVKKILQKNDYHYSNQ